MIKEKRKEVQSPYGAVLMNSIFLRHQGLINRGRQLSRRKPFVALIIRRRPRGARGVED